MADQVIPLACACPCGASRLVVRARPQVRYLCHCLTCQAVHRGASVDMTALRADDVTLADGHAVQFKEYRKPPAIRRGACAACGFALVGLLEPMPGMRLAFVPAAAYAEPAVLPPPRMHIYYHRRVGDVDDALPKYASHWRSQLATMPLMLKVMFARSTRA